MSLILASGSPRRKELLALITPEYTVLPSDFDESALTAPTPGSWPWPWPAASAGRRPPCARAIRCWGATRWWNLAAGCSASQRIKRTRGAC